MVLNLQWRGSGYGQLLTGGNKSMLSRISFSILLLLTFFTTVSLANFPQYKLSLHVKRPILLTRNSQYAIPAGDYLVKDIGEGTGSVFALERRSDYRHVAYLSTVRERLCKDRTANKPAVYFDYESECGLPVLKMFCIPEVSLFKVVGVTYDSGNFNYLDVAKLIRPGVQVSTEPVGEQTTPANDTIAPAPSVVTDDRTASTVTLSNAEPASPPQPASADPQPTDKTEQSDVVPVDKRPRLRKD